MSFNIVWLFNKKKVSAAYLSFIKIAKANGRVFENWEKPRYGFCGWFWLPKFSKSGRLSQREVLNIDIYWLCFGIGILVFPN